MLLFRSEETVEAWCAQRNLPVRPMVTLDQLWMLAQAWYSARLGEHLSRPGPDEMKQIFARIGLTDSFWDLNPPQA
jgi:hypothetical protein